VDPGACDPEVFDPHRMVSKFISILDGIAEFTGRVTTGLVVVMVGVTVYDVVMRYVFRQGSVALQELEWHLFSAIFLLGAAYTLKHDGHVRVDVLYRSRQVSDGLRRTIDIAGIALFLLPFCALVVWASMPFVHDAWVHGEMSPDPGGLPHRWAVKAFIPLGFSLLFVQGLADLCRLITNARAGV
jgi:TRAP-type mannitol/chloroaromatic compound transport system permease small subunit